MIRLWFRTPLRVAVRPRNGPATYKYRELLSALVNYLHLGQLAEGRGPSTWLLQEPVPKGPHDITDVHTGEGQVK